MALRAHSFLRHVGLTLFAVLSFQGISGAVVLDTGLISISASGSINTIGGFGHVDDLLKLPAGAALEGFEIELQSFVVHPTIGLPSSHSLEFRRFAPFSTGNVNFANGVFLGQTVIVSPDTNQAAYEKLLGFVEGTGVPEPQIFSTISWNFGGLDVSSTSMFELRALGTAAEPALTVTEPSTVLLMLTALLLVRFGVRLPEP